MNDDQIRELLREMRDEPLPPDSLARVRTAVAARTRGRPHRWRLAALAAAACLLLAVVLFRPKPPAVAHRPEPPVVALGPVAAPPLAPPKTAQPIVRPVHKKRRPPRRQSPTLIRIETPDPDVVILLIGN